MADWDFWVLERHYAGWTRGVNRRTGQKGFFPNYKVAERWRVVPFPLFDTGQSDGIGCGSSATTPAATAEFHYSDEYKDSFGRLEEHTRELARLFGDRKGMGIARPEDLKRQVDSYLAEFSKFATISGINKETP